MGCFSMCNLSVCAAKLTWILSARTWRHGDFKLGMHFSCDTKLQTVKEERKNVKNSICKAERLGNQPDTVQCLHTATLQN